MGVSVFPVPSSGGAALKPTIVTLTSGTSWTVPTGVTNINATLQGGGGGGGSTRVVGASADKMTDGSPGNPGQMITTNVATTPGASIAYAIGAGGAAASTGGTTTFTGATSAVGGSGKGINSTGAAGTSQAGFLNAGAGGNSGGTSSGQTGGAGGAGVIIIEYWT